MKNILSKIILTIPFIILFSSCNSKKETITSQLEGFDISLNDEFKVLKFESQGFSDIIYQFEIIVTSSDSSKIVNEVKSREYFTYDVPEQKQLEPFKDNNKQAYFEEDYYYIDYFNDSTLIRESLFFYPKEKRIKYTYNDG